MNFGELLNEICSKVKGAVACSIMGFDGIPVENVVAQPNDFDIQTLLIEYANMAQQIRQTAETLANGMTEEVIIRTEKIAILLRLVTDEYFIALILRPEGNVGQGRYRLRISSAQLKPELTV